jgi:XRE family aerobic/anaerobic benzoate catabolism transcriptional regulator
MTPSPASPFSLTATAGAGLRRDGAGGQDGAAAITRPERRQDLLAGLGRTVRRLRAERRLSRQQLAEAAGLSPRYLAQLEAGGGNISVARLAEVARALEASLPALLAQADGGKASGGEGASLRGAIEALLPGLGLERLRALLAELREENGRGTPAAPALVALVGLRGAGKSTVGPLLARSLRCPFVELDEVIQERTGLAVGEIFELHGERYYRDAERRALQHLLERDAPAVVAVSGGAVTDPETFRLLREGTLLVWLKAPPEAHMARVATQGDRRPMADRPNAMKELRALLAARVPYYEQARLIADTGTASPQECAEKLAAALREL